MSHADRLLESGSDIERALLRAGADEGPPPERVRAAARALGIVPATVLGSAALASGLKWLRGSWVAYTFVPLFGLAVLGAAYWSHARARRAPASSADRTAPALDARATEPAAAPIAPAAPVSDPAGAAAEPPPAVARPTSPNRAGHATSPRPAASARDGDFQRQLAMVEQARAFVGQGATGDALRLLDSYDRAFPAGAFAEEAALIRIQALAARGDRRRAADHARRFLAAYPDSVHRDAVIAIQRRNTD